MARLVAQKMAENLRTTVFVENKAGGNFIPALRELTSSPPDGHTLFFISTSSLITQPLHPDYPFDLTKLTPVTQVATGPLILVARNDLGIKTRARADRLRRQESRTSSASAWAAGTGSSLYLATELLKARTGIKISIDPLPGSGTGAERPPGRAHRRDVRCDAGRWSPQAKTGKVTPLAVTGKKRSSLAARRADHPGGGREL